MESLLNNEDSVADALHGSTLLYKKAFLDRFEVLQERILYAGIAYVSLAVVVTSLVLTRAVVSIGTRTR